jgi:hypothetical protein
MLTASWLYAMAGGGGDNAYIAPLEVLRSEPARVSAYHLWINKYLRPGDRVLSVGDAAVFDIEVPVVYSTVFDDCLFESLMRNRTGEERRAALDALGITHVYVNWAEIDRYRGPGNYGFSDFVQPEIFDELVEQGVLARILFAEPIAHDAIYQVQPAALTP